MPLPIRCASRLFLFAASALATPAALLAANEKFSLVIALDGTRADTLLSGSNANIRSLVNGTWASGYNTAYTGSAQTSYDANTWSGPNHGGIMTGVSGGTLGITGNSDVASGNFAAYPHYLSRIETALPTANTAYLVTWGTDYSAIPYGGSTPGSVFANNPASNGDVTNTAIAAGLLAGTYSGTATNGKTWSAGAAPTATFVFLDDPDHAGHSYGFDAANTNYKSAVTTADAQIGQLLTAIKSRANFANEDWQIVITSDHGGLPNAQHGTTNSNGNETTIPFLVTSKTVQAGVLSGVVRNYDAATTALNFLGVSYPTGTDTNPLAGRVQGAAVEAVTPGGLGAGLVAHLRFDGDLTDASGRGNNATAMGVNAPVVSASGGKFGGSIHINGAGSYATLGNPTDLQFAAGQDYSISLWFKTASLLSGDAPLISNKNWGNGGNAGFVLGPGLTGTGTAGRGVGFNAGDGAGHRIDANAIAFAANEWNFVSVAVMKDGTVILYTGGADGALHWIATDITAVGTMISGLPVNIGQDGTGTYGVALNADIDDLGIWRRALTQAEVTSLYNGGAGNTIASQIAAVPEPGTYGLLGGVALAGLALIRRSSRKIDVH